MIVNTRYILVLVAENEKLCFFKNMTDKPKQNKTQKKACDSSDASPSNKTGSGVTTERCKL